MSTTNESIEAPQIKQPVDTVELGEATIRFAGDSGDGM